MIERHTDPVTSRAFSVIELLVSIGVIGVLIAIIVPSLGRAKGSALQAITLSNLHQTSLTFEQYLETYKETYPWAPEGAWFLISPTGEEESRIQPGYWDLKIYWVALMHEIAPWREYFSTWVDPGLVKAGELPWRRESIEGAGIPSYLLSDTFFGDPELWLPGTKASDTLLRAVHASEVLYPASKVMLYDAEQGYLRTSPQADRDPMPMLFTDGHALVKRVSQAARPASIPFKPGTMPLQDTPGGVRGRDY